MMGNMSMFDEYFGNLHRDSDPAGKEMLKLSVLKRLSGEILNTSGGSASYEHFHRLNLFFDFFENADADNLVVKKYAVPLLEELVNDKMELLIEYANLDSVIKKYQLTDQYLKAALSYYEQVTYSRFEYSSYVRRLLRLYQSFQEEIVDRYDSLFVDALYKHITGLGDSEINYEFGGLETVRKNIAILNQTSIELLLKKYESSSVENFPFGWSYLGNNVLEKQIKTVINYSSLEPGYKSFLIYKYIDGLRFKSYILRHLYGKMWTFLKDQYAISFGPIQSLDDPMTLRFKHNQEESMDFGLRVQSEKAANTAYTFSGQREWYISQIYSDSEIKISFHRPGIKASSERFVYDSSSSISNNEIHRRLEDPMSSFVDDFLSQKGDQTGDVPQQSDSEVEQQFDMAIVYAMRSEMEGLKSVVQDWALLKDGPAAFDETTNYYSCNFVDEKTGRKVKVVTACCPQKGMAATATLSTKLICLFQPEYLVMTGIAAGIRQETEDEPDITETEEKNRRKIGFGDVLVATVSWDHGSGKITTLLQDPELSEEGKKASQFMPAPNPINLQPRILSRIELLANDAETLNDIHLNWGKRPEISKSRKSGPSGLFIHCGPILSGAAVLANNEAIAQIKRQHKDLIGIDMECYSVFYAAENSPGRQPKVFVMKSVSDYADEKKNDDYQAYAMYTSAATLKALALKYLEYSSYSSISGSTEIK